MRVSLQSNQRKVWLALSLSFFLAFLASCSSSQPQVNPQTLTDRERDGLVGNVKAVLTEDVVLTEQNGLWGESQQATSTAIYDEAGKRTSQTPFRVAMVGGFAITQHELLFDPAQKNQQVEEKQSGAAAGGYWVKSYDGKGNLIERTLFNASRSPVKKENFSYEFDARGNWIKRSVRQISAQAGQSLPQFTEGSYRHIVYFDSPGNSSSQPPAELIPASAKQLKNPMAATPENVNRGNGLFLQRCASCHGEDGKAQTEFAATMPTKPADLTAPRASALSEGEIYSLISDGIKSSGMPALKGRIGEEAVWQIALYVRQLSHPDQKQLTAKASPTPAKNSASAEAERRYNLTGKIISIESESKVVTVEHDDIKGYMEAMTMNFPLKDEKVLARLKKGDKIQATLIVGIGYWRLENVVIK